MVNNGRGNQTAESSDTRNCKGAAAQVFQSAFARLGFRVQPIQFAGDLRERLAVRVMKHRHDEASRRRRRHSDVIMIEKNNLLGRFVQGGIDDRYFPESFRHRFHKKRQIGELDSSF